MNIPANSFKKLPFIMGMILGIGCGGLLADISIGRTGMYGYLIGMSFNIVTTILLLWHEHKQDKKYDDKLVANINTFYKPPVTWVYTCPHCNIVMGQTFEPPVISDITDVECPACKEVGYPQITTENNDSTS